MYICTRLTGVARLEHADLLLSLQGIHLDGSSVVRHSDWCCSPATLQGKGRERCCALTPSSGRTIHEFIIMNDTPPVFFFLCKSHDSHRHLYICTYHYRKLELCRVSYDLSNAKSRTLSKEPLCQVPHLTKVGVDNGWRWHKHFTYTTFMISISEWLSERILRLIKSLKTHLC
jgi:hypothetical protein